MVLCQDQWKWGSVFILVHSSSSGMYPPAIKHGDGKPSFFRYIYIYMFFFQHPFCCTSDCCTSEGVGHAREAAGDGEVGPR